MALFVDIKKTLGDFSLSVSFETGDKVHGVLGPSGCGKSLTLQCIAGVLTPDSGRIILDGVTLFDSDMGVNLPPQRRQVGLLFQHYALFPNMTACGNIAAVARHQPDGNVLCNQLLERLGLTNVAQHFPHQLSGGQQQRVALARMLAARPKLLLLDEPFAALDEHLRWETELTVLEVLEDFGGNALLVSHRQDEVCRLCGMVTVLDGGTSQPAAPTHQLFSAPKTLAACLLTGCKNISRASAAGDGTVLAHDWGVTLKIGQTIPPHLTHIGVRSHHLSLGIAGEENTVPCTVLRVIDNLFSTIVMVATPGGEAGNSRLRIDLPTATWVTLQNPAQLHIAISPAAILPLEG